MERPAFSDMLCERRRQLGYSIRQASSTLMLREDILIAFEEGNFEQIPKSGYAQGMLSSYARYLGLDANMVVDAFTRDLDRYMREMRHQHKGEAERSRTGIYNLNTNQYGERIGTPYVTSRGLLPTSGGPAGDLGSFSTTRVRPRNHESATETGSFYVQDRVSSGYENVQPMKPLRPYTARTPRVTNRTNPRSWGAGGDIRTQDTDSFGYTDDIETTNRARNYEAASTGKGRRSSRNISDTSRPRINRNTGGHRGNTRNNGRGANPLMGAIASGSMIVPAIVILAVVLISVVLVVSVSSCVRKGSEARTVPVSAAIEAEQSQTSTSETTQENQATAADAQATAATDAAQTQEPATPGAASATGETSVSVSVDAGAVTWLEIECDGVSEVAETITGPWQHTYTVEDSIMVQAGDTTAVSVVQNGNQVQFDSMASGIGTLRIQGTKPPTSKKDKDQEATQTESQDGSSAHTGNQAQTDQQGSATSEGDTQSEGTSDAGVEGSGATDESAYDASGYGYDESGYDTYGYDEYGYGTSDYGYDEYGYDSYDSYGYDYDEGYY